jgi:hypothetical protein
MTTSTTWRQVIVVRGDALCRLREVTDLTISQANNTLVLRGVGGHFPEISSIDWAAGCGPQPESKTGLSDIRPILAFLINESMILTSDAPREEIAAWLRENRGNAL